MAHEEVEDKMASQGVDGHKTVKAVKRMVEAC
jgi:hypothetical protein